MLMWGFNESGKNQRLSLGERNSRPSCYLIQISYAGLRDVSQPTVNGGIERELYLHAML